MKMKCLSFLFILVVSTIMTAADAFMSKAEGDLPDGGKIWVLLVAGSRGYFNYRHQADICHAYHVSWTFLVSWSQILQINLHPNACPNISRS